MAVSYSANAVYAKAHVMYGKRLKKQNYDELINCHSLTELVNYLKTRTQYSKVFENVPSDITPTQIEELLKLHLLENFESLCRYEISAGENFYQYFIVKNDISQILSFIRMLINGTPEKYLNSLPPFFNKHTELDLYKMANARSYKELLSAVSGSPYKALLAPFADIYKENGVYIKIESALNDYVKDFLFSIIKRSAGKKEKEQIHDIINYKFDMDTVVNIYRLTRLADADSADIKGYINTKFTNFSQKEINMLIDAPLARDMMRLIPQTCYRKDFANLEYTYLEGAVQRVMYSKLAKSMRYFTNPTAAMICYVFLAENEVQNITHIVEGIKYNIPAKNIGAILVGAEN